MPQDTAGPQGAANAIANAKAALSEANRKFPSPPSPPAAETTAAPNHYRHVAAQREKDGSKAPKIIIPAGDTSGQELRQAERNADELKEALKPQQ